MCVSEAGKWSEVSFDKKNTRLPMCMTEAGRWSERRDEEQRASSPL